MITAPISSGLYYDFSFPLTLVNFLIDLLKGRQHNPNVPQVTQNTGPRQWFSQPREMTDPTVECHTTRYKLPLSISEITFSALRVPCHIEVWYQDRSNNWLQMRDEIRLPIGIDLSGSEMVSWYTYHTSVYPIVAKAVQIRAKRKADDLLKGQPFVIGLANILCRRNVYDRANGTQAFEDEQDQIGNIIAKYVRDWDAPLAIDDNATTFWRSAGLPDPAGVVSYYLDISDKVTGAPSAVSRLFIDPLYSNQNLNIYYSSDPTVGTRKLSPITAVPTTDTNTKWTMGTGRRDISTGLAAGTYQWNMALGPLLRQDAWVGIEWTPDFPADDAPAANPVLFKVTPGVATTGVYTPSIFYDGGAGEIVLELKDGTTTIETSAALADAWAPGVPLRIVVGWRYGVELDEDSVYIAVENSAGDNLAVQLSHPELPDHISFDGTMGFDRFRGLMTAHIVKLESYPGRVEAFQINPIVYVNPDPVIPDPNGNVPSTSLDSAIFAADWTAQEHGTGGNHDTSFSDKEWTPIWKNYITERGTLYFPQTIVARYLKLECTNLTPEPYPIYDSGIKVTYQVFPISVQQQSSQGLQIYSQPGGFLGLGDVISVNGIRTVNWLNPLSILNAVQAVFGNTVDPVVINTQPPIITDSIPANTGIANASSTYGIELGNSYIYRRDALNPYILARDQYYTTIKAEGLQQIAAFTDVPWQVIEASNPGAIQHRVSPGALPIRGTDWWIFPGQTIKIPASVMTQLTSGSTVTDFHLDLSHRTRFTTTSVHRYETRTLVRDKAIAYFAGFREIQPYTTTYIAGQDVDSFEFTSYDPSQWTMVNTVQADTGPVSTNGTPYAVPNGKFLSGLNHWEQRQGVWGQDLKVDHTGQLSSAHVFLTGNNPVNLVSEIIPVEPGDDIILSDWIRYNELVGGTDPTVSLRVIPCLDGVEEPVEDLGGDFAVWEGREGRTDGYVFEKLVGTYLVPGSGVNGIKIVAHAHGYTAGEMWVDDIDMTPADGGEAIMSKSFQTTSTFNMVQCDFRDSGLVRSDPMWADIDPLDDTNIPNDVLTWYTTPIPSTIPRGFWADSFATWADPEVAWGEPHAVVAVNIDGTLVYDGKRTLHFTRDAGEGQAGVRVRQWTHFIPDAKARIVAIFRKQVDNDNEVTVRLRRISDGVVIYEETLTDTPTGFWYQYQSPFFDIPDEIDQVYNLEFTLEGDDADDMYLSDIYCEISNLRYFVLLGDSGPTNPYIDVTDLIYSGKETYISSTVPVSTMSVQIAIKSPEAWAIGATLTPNYLRT